MRYLENGESGPILSCERQHGGFNSTWKNDVINCNNMWFGSKNNNLWLSMKVPQNEVMNKLHAACLAVSMDKLYVWVFSVKAKMIFLF